MKTTELLNAIEILKETINTYKASHQKTFFANIQTEIDYEYELGQSEDITSYDKLVEKLDEQGAFNIDVIYYATAMEYLSENDPSLNESMALAAEMCFTPENINSETLASLLKSQNVREEFSELESEFDTYFEELEEINDHLSELDDMVEAIENSEGLISDSLIEDFEAIECEY